jgi:hypothetical protein
LQQSSAKRKVEGEVFQVGPIQRAEPDRCDTHLTGADDTPYGMDVLTPELAGELSELKQKLGALAEQIERLKTEKVRAGGGLLPIVEPKAAPAALKTADSSPAQPEAAKGPRSAR